MTHHKPETKKRRSGLWLPDRSLSVILFLIFLFGVFSVIYTDSTNASQEEQRRLAYGSWHIAAYDTDQETCRLFQSHATVQTAGYMEIYGSIAKAPGQTEPVLGSIGYADPNALAVGSIVLLNGRLPNTKNEIAVEADALRRLGLSGTLGQQLTLAVFPSDVRSAPRAAIQTYQLCGIVRNYSKNWKTDGYPLPSFFVCKNSPDATEPALLHVFAQMKPAFAANAAELSSLCSWHSYFVQNDFTYPQYGKEPDPAPLFSVLQMILLLSGALLTLTLMQADIRQRSHSLLILRTLGASRAQIFHFFLREKARLIGSSSGPGILCGILLAYLVSLPPGLLAGPDICSIRIPHLIKMVFCLYAGVILASAASLGSLLHMPLKNASCRQVRKTRFRRRTKKHPDTIACLFRASDRRYHFFQTMLTFAAAVFLFIPVYRALHAGNAYLQYQNDFPEDYTFGTLSSAPPHSTITEDALLQIRETYGVKDTMAVSVSGSCRIRDKIKKWCWSVKAIERRIRTFGEC